MNMSKTDLLEWGIFAALNSLAFLYVIIVILKSGKRRLEDIWYLIFWCFGFLFWFPNAVGTFLWNYNFAVANICMMTDLFFIIFHIASGPFYLLSKITTNKIAHSILGVLSLVLIGFYLSSWLPNARLVKGLPYVYYNAGNMRQGYVIAFFILIMILPSIYVLLREFDKSVTQGDWSGLYAFYAIILYAGLSVPAVLRILTIPLRPFYLLIPYLVYLGYRKQKTKTK